MNVFGPFGLGGNNTLDEVNEFLDERRLNEESNPLALDSTSLIRAFKEKVNCVMLIGDFARRFAHLCNQESSSYHFKKPKMEGPEHKTYMIF